MGLKNDESDYTDKYINRDSEKNGAQLFDKVTSCMSNKWEQ